MTRSIPKSVTSSLRNVNLTFGLYDPQPKAVSKQPRERIDVRCLEAAADADVRGAGRDDEPSAVVAIEFLGRIDERGLIEREQSLTPAQLSGDDFGGAGFDTHRGAVGDYFVAA